MACPPSIHDPRRELRIRTAASKSGLEITAKLLVHQVDTSAIAASARSAAMAR